MEPDTKQNDTLQDPPTKSKPAEEQTFDLDVGGEKKTVTLDEMRALAQKSAGADRKFSEASEMRKSAEVGLRFQTLYETLSDGKHTPTEMELNEMAGMLGVDSTEFRKLMIPDENVESSKSDTEKTTALDGKSIIEALKQEGIDLAEAKAILAYSHNGHVEAAKHKIREISDQAVDKDDIFGKMIVGDNGKDRLSSIKDMVAEDVLRRIQDGQSFGTELVTSSIQKVRGHLTKLGIPGKPDRYPIVMGLGPGDGLPAEVQSETPIKRINTVEDGDGGNFVARAMQKGLRSLRNNTH